MLADNEQDPAAFFPWLIRQDRSGEPGRLFLRLCADLCAAKWPEMPESLGEVQEWAKTARRNDPEVQQLLPVVVKYWRRWLATTDRAALEQEVTR